MTVINAENRFKARRYSDLWVSTRSGGLGLLVECQAEAAIRGILAAVVEKYPQASQPVALAWDDKSCAHLEIFYEGTAPGDTRGHVEVDDGYYEVTLTPMSRSAA